MVIHRVVAIAPDGTVTTKGDAKEKIDPFTVPRTAIDTRVLTHIPAAGQAFGFLGSTLGLLWLAGGAALLFGLPLLERYRESQRRVVGRPRGARARAGDAPRAGRAAPGARSSARSQPRSRRSNRPRPVRDAPRGVEQRGRRARRPAPAAPRLVAARARARRRPPPPRSRRAVVRRARRARARRRRAVPHRARLRLPAPAAHVLAAAIVVTPLVAAPARVVSATQFAALALAAHAAARAARAAGAARRFPPRPPVASACRGSHAVAPRRRARPGALCAVGGP